MKKCLLTEMAIYDEDEVFSLQPVANVTTNGLEQLEGPDFISHIVKTIDTSNLPEDYVLTIRELNEIYSHHCAYRTLKKAAFLALPQILQAKLVLSSWKKKKAQDGSKSNDNRVSGLMGAPIIIDNVKYLCLVGMRKNLKGIITPYTITLKDENGNIIGDKKVNSDIIVPDSNNGTSAFGSTHLSTDTASLDANSPSNANIDKNNKTDKNESKNMSRKNTIRLTESELKSIIAESVKDIVNEVRYGGESLHGNNAEDWNAIANLRDDRYENPREFGVPYDTEEDWDNYKAFREKNKRNADKARSNAFDINTNYGKASSHDFFANSFDNHVKGMKKYKNIKKNLSNVNESYNPVHEGIMNFHSDMNALRSDIDEIIEGLYDTNARERLRLMDKKLAQIGAEFAKIESTLNFLGNQN